MNLETNLTESNMYNVFDCIVLNGPITKKGIQQSTSLSWGSVSNICNNLLELGIINKEKQKSETPGRRPQKYDINDAENYIIGVDIAVNNIIGHVTTLKGTTVNKYCINLISNEINYVIESLFLVLNNLIKPILNRKKIHYIGIALPGLVSKDGQPTFAHHFEGSFPLDLFAKVQSKFKIKTKIFHDPDCVLAYQTKNLSKEEQKSSVMLIRWSYGIGMSMMVNGDYYRGANSAAGEIGHMVLDPSGPVCTCGKTGCLESYASLQSMIKCVKMGVGLGLDSNMLNNNEKISNITEKEIFNLYKKGDKYIIGIVNEVFAHMAKAIINVVNIFDPKVVLIAGEFASAPKECLDLLIKLVNERRWINAPINIIICNENDAAALGASNLLRKEVYTKIVNK